MKKTMISAVFLGLFAAFAWFQQPTQEAEAACGAAVSSCKTCHETQGQKPVNKTGAWHTGHAFGDFCENCHGGAVAQTDKGAAHTGMHPVLSQANQSCSSCHEADLTARVTKYGGQVTATPGGPATAANSNSGSSAPPPPPGGGSPQDLIDFNKEWLKKNTESPTWNFVLLGINLLLLGGFGYMLYSMAQKPAKEQAAALAQAAELTPELQSLASKLTQCDPDTLQALNDLLDRGPLGYDLLRQLAQLPPEAAEGLASLSQEEQTLILMMAAKKQS